MFTFLRHCALNLLNLKDKSSIERWNWISFYYWIFVHSFLASLTELERERESNEMENFSKINYRQGKHSLVELKSIKKFISLDRTACFDLLESNQIKTFPFRWIQVDENKSENAMVLLAQEHSDFALD